MLSRQIAGAGGYGSGSQARRDSLKISSGIFRTAWELTSRWWSRCVPRGFPPYYRSFDEVERTFTTFTDELSLALHRRGLELEPKAHGVMRQEGKEVAHVVSWHPGKGVLILGRSAEWNPRTETRINLGFQPTKRGTRLTVDHSGLERLFNAKQGEVLGWFTDQVVASLVNSSVPSQLGDWITDRRARRPTSAIALKTYRNPTHHAPTSTRF